MKITGKTTLAELALLRAQLGVTKLTLEIHPVDQDAVIAYVYTTEYTTIGTGAVEHEALDDAFCRATHRQGEVVMKAHAEIKLKPRACGNCASEDVYETNGVWMCRECEKRQTSVH